LKLKIVNEVLSGKVTISQQAREYNLARKKIYEWIKKYQSAQKKGIIGVTALKEACVRGENHPRALAPGVRSQILKIVIERPQLTIRDFWHNGVTQNLPQ